MTKPPDTLGTQYANLTLSGSSLISEAAVKRASFEVAFEVSFAPLV